MLFDLRGHGESDGDLETLTSNDFLLDVTTAYDLLAKTQGVDSNNMSIVGSSKGGYLAAILSSKRSARNLVLRVPADYPDNTFDKPRWDFSGDNPDVLKWRSIPRSWSETRALSAVHKFAGNILIIESEKDDLVPHTILENYRKAVPNEKRLTYILMKGAPHSIQEGPFRDQVEQILVDWFRDKKF